jgi:hypothetical protein
MPTFGEFADKERISDAERKHLAEMLVSLRRSDAYWGGGGVGVPLSNMHMAIRACAYRAERRAARTFSKEDLIEMKSLDAAGNLLLAVWMHFDDVRPILARWAKGRPVQC